MMNKQEYLLTVLQEEAAEISQRICKILRFGFDEVQPEQEWDNTQRFTMEVNDFLAVLEMLQENGVTLKGLANPLPLAAKKAKVEKFMKLSVAQGCLTLDK